jgi:spore germination protein YaaH
MESGLFTLRDGKKISSYFKTIFTNSAFSLSSSSINENLIKSKNKDSNESLIKGDSDYYDNKYNKGLVASEENNSALEKLEDKESRQIADTSHEAIRDEAQSLNPQSSNPQKRLDTSDTTKSSILPQVLVQPDFSSRVDIMGNPLWDNDLSKKSILSNKPVFNLNSSTSVHKSVHQIEDNFYRQKQFDFKEPTFDDQNSDKKTMSPKTSSEFEKPLDLQSNTSTDDKQNNQPDSFMTETNSLATVPTNPYVNKTVMGFLPYWTLDTYDNFHMQNLSIIAYFSVACNGDGSLVRSGTRWDAWNSGTFRNMVHKAHRNDVKVVLVIQNFHGPSIKSIVGNQSARNRLINNIVNEVKAKNIDGVNIDFETFSASTSTERAQFANFMDQLADRMHSEIPGSHVSVDIIGSSAISTSLIYDVRALGQTSIDAIMVMAYDFHTTGSTYAGPVAPLYGSQYWYTVSRAMRDMKSQAPASKLIMGVPYYGLEYIVEQNTWDNKNGRVKSGGIASYRSITDSKYDAWHNNTTIKWDNREKMRWYKYRWYDPASGSDFCQGYYDDDESLAAKYDFVYNENLAGIGIWALGYDDGREELWDVMQEKFSKEPFWIAFSTDMSTAERNSIVSRVGGKVCGDKVMNNVYKICPQNQLSYNLIKKYKQENGVIAVEYIPQNDKELVEN